METLDHQNSVINEQAEELALFRAKMRHFEYLMDAFKHSKGTLIEGQEPNAYRSSSQRVISLHGA